MGSGIEFLHGSEVVILGGYIRMISGLQLDFRWLSLLSDELIGMEIA